MEDKKPGLIDKIKNYLKETQAEAKKVSWPDKKYVLTATAIIIVMVLAFGFALMLVDYGLSQTLKILTRAR